MWPAKRSQKSQRQQRTHINVEPQLTSFGSKASTKYVMRVETVIQKGTAMAVKKTFREKLEKQLPGWIVPMELKEKKASQVVTVIKAGEPTAKKIVVIKGDKVIGHG